MTDKEIIKMIKKIHKFKKLEMELKGIIQNFQVFKSDVIEYFMNKENRI
jgi:hypothetical protein